MALTGVFGAITSISETTSAQDEDQTRRVAIANIMCYCGLYIEERFDMTDEDYCAYAVWSWQKMLEFHENYRSVNSYRALFDKESVERFNNKILKYSHKILEDTSATVLIISYVSTGGAPMQLWYSIDGSDKYILPSGESCQHFLEIGEHTFRTLNPFNKKTQTIVVDGETRVNVQGKGLKMIIN